MKICISTKKKCFALQLEIFEDVEIDGYDSSLYEVKQMKYNSTGGVEVPMYIVHKKVCNPIHSSDNVAEIFQYFRFRILFQMFLHRQCCMAMAALT